MESALPQKKKPWSGKGKSPEWSWSMRQKHWHTLSLTLAHNVGFQNASTTHASSRTMGAYAHTQRLCVFSPVITPGQDILIFRVHVCKSSRVGVPKLHGWDTFHSCSRLCTVRCTRMLILPHFTDIVHSQAALQAGFVCFPLLQISSH